MLRLEERNLVVDAVDVNLDEIAHLPLLQDLRRTAVTEGQSHSTPPRQLGGAGGGREEGGGDFLVSLVVPTPKPPPDHPKTAPKQAI